MNDNELDQILKSARLPEGPPGHWENFPGRVTRQLRQPHLETGAEDSWRPAPFWRGLGWGFAAACLVCLCSFGLWTRYHGRAAEARQLAMAEKCYREIDGMFPHQLSAIILNAQGSGIKLADTANLPDSPPIFLRVCGPGGCQTIITFSGQRVRLGGEDCDVLAGNAGRIIVVGDSAVWTSDKSSRQFNHFQVTATMLNPAS